MNLRVYSVGNFNLFFAESPKYPYSAKPQNAKYVFGVSSRNKLKSKYTGATSITWEGQPQVELRRHLPQRNPHQSLLRNSRCLDYWQFAPYIVIPENISLGIPVFLIGNNHFVRTGSTNWIGPASIVTPNE